MVCLFGKQFILYWFDKWSSRELLISWHNAVLRSHADVPLTEFIFVCSQPQHVQFWGRLVSQLLSSGVVHSATFSILEC